MNFNLNRSRRAAEVCRGFDHFTLAGLSLAIVLAVFSPRLSAQLLVGSGFPNPSNNVLRVNPATAQVLGVFGSAVNFSPAPGAMAQDSLGRVYILESNENRIRRFGPTGNFIDFFASGAFGGGLGLITGIVIDAADNIYVSSGGANTFSVNDDAIVRFSSSGTPLGTFGQATNAASGYIAGGPLEFDSQGNLYTGYAGQIVRYSPTGAALGVFANTPSILGLAFNSQGDLFVSGSDVMRFSPSGAPLGTFASNSGSIGLDFDGAGNLFVANPSDNTLRKYSPAGALLATLSVNGGGNVLMLVPEPGGLFLLGAAVGWLVVTRQRRYA
jgi:sugar lactone lactonase YvrE